MKNTALVQYKLMLPAALKKRVECAAAANRRSLSQEIVDALEEKYPDLDSSNFDELLEHARQIKDVTDPQAVKQLVDDFNAYLEDQKKGAKVFISYTSGEADRAAKALLEFRIPIGD